ncbi:unnamed protein product [Durusdinium trenchii]
MKGMDQGKVNYTSAAEGLVSLADNVTKITGKIHGTRKQERIIQGVGRCVQGATGLLMQISPALGPASPFVYGISLAFNVAAGVMMSITASPGNSSASQSVSQASGFQYDLSGLETKIKQNFQQMGWEFQLTLLSLKKVEDEMEDMVRHLTHQLQEISVELESLHKQLVSMQVEPSLSTMNIVMTMHQDYLRALTGEEDMVAVLEPYIPQLIEHELTLRASLVSTLERLVDCGACGGAAAGSLWFARFLQARYQVWTMLWHYRQVTNNLDQVQVMIDHLRKDQELLWPQLLQRLGLAAWMRLSGSQLAKYFISSASYMQVEQIIDDLGSTSWPQRLSAAQHLAERIEASGSGGSGAAAAVPALRGLLAPPESAWKSQNHARNDFFGVNEQQSACRQAAEVLEQLGYPAAWAATVDLERLKHRTWSKTRSDASTLTLLSPCAKASRKTLQTLKQQEQQTRL